MARKESARERGGGGGGGGGEGGKEEEPKEERRKKRVWRVGHVCSMQLHDSMSFSGVLICMDTLLSQS